ncbi:MAG: DUF370 domain-containing protein [Firmicutes bacterium]|nr:DUF370 domain-containing protein [Bacillota bacterium]MBQ9604241.1 DUF370 domain-containing protein [Bacillota bacterium]
MTMFKPINIGFGNIVMANRIIAVISPESAPVKRMIQDAKESGSIIDATYGRKTKAVIVTDGGIVLSALLPETISSRIAQPADDNE